MNTLHAVVRENKIEIPENFHVPEGTEVLVTFPEDAQEKSFWQEASNSSLKKIWDNKGDDVYEELLKR